MENTFTHNGLSHDPARADFKQKYSIMQESYSNAGVFHFEMNPFIQMTIILKKKIKKIRRNLYDFEKCYVSF